MDVINFSQSVPVSYITYRNLRGNNNCRYWPENEEN